MRAGQPLHGADLTKPDLVQRDQAVTLIYQTAGVYLTVRGKATEAGTDGDVVTVLNLQSKRTVSGVVVGRGQVSVSPVTPVVQRRLASATPVTEAPAMTASSAPIPPSESVPVSPKAE
jgi:flagella basal body P-ring formation protein FlgA